MEFELILQDIPFSNKFNNTNSDFDFNRANYHNIRADISLVDWRNILCSLSTEDSVALFYSIIKNIMSKHIPKYFKCRTKFPQWFSVSTVKVIREKNRIHRKWKIYQNRLDYLTFKLLRGRSKYLIDLDYKNYLDRTEASILSDPKQIWHFVKSKRGKSSAITALQNPISNELTTDGHKICDTFSSYFSSVFNPPNANPNYTSSNQGFYNSISNYYIPISTIIQKIKELPDKAAGIDNIPTKLLKECVYAIAEPLYIIFNKSLKEGHFPQVWKSALIVPILKSGNKFLAENYRPISI